MTLAEKILASHCDKKKVTPGEFINARVDLVMANDIAAASAIMGKIASPEEIIG